MRLRTFTVVPSLPKRLEPLYEIAQNLWWTWNPDAVDLFRRLDHELWSQSDHNPVAMLGQISQERIHELERDLVFTAHMDRIHKTLTDYMEMPTWASQNHPEFGRSTIAYFSMEFGIHESLPIYAGGLGVLAGDHFKSASELGLPMVGVGILYRKGYFHQYLSTDGWQQESYPENDFYNMPVRLIRMEDGRPVRITVDVGGRPVELQAWKAQVGRVALYLLDASLDANHPDDRLITCQLYAPGLEMRIRQEIILGIGGVRMLAALGIEPQICHMNEGHAAFLGLERIRLLMDKTGLKFHEAAESIGAGGVFTTHTPVAAGIDIFSPELVERYFTDYMKAMGVSVRELLALGRQNPDNNGEPLSMAVLAIKLSCYRNAVSKLHGEVSRSMWTGVWPRITENEVPIGHVTNGIHTRTWLSDEFARLYDRYLGPDWIYEPLGEELWQRIWDIPDNELWRAKERLRERLVGYVRRTLKKQLKARGAGAQTLRDADEILDPEALTIGFARRFATYKRGTLIFRDVERLARIMNNQGRHVQIIIAGKAHPADDEGKRFIQEIIHHCRRKEFRKHLVFLEDYDLDMARYLVQGVDVWLNNPRRPLEASGTSGMKVPPNGGINLSVLDGWWDEAYDGEVGWAIGHGEESPDVAFQDEAEASALLELLEDELAPLFYDRKGEDDLPRRWINKMKTSMQRLIPVYNTNRMVKEYTEKYYLPALAHHSKLTATDHRAAKALVRWKGRVLGDWGQVGIVGVEEEEGRERAVGEEQFVRVRTRLGSLSPEDLQIEIYFGRIDSFGSMQEPRAIAMHPTSQPAAGEWIFEGRIPCKQAGKYGFTIRVLPRHPNLINAWEAGKVVWWEN